MMGFLEGLLAKIGVGALKNLFGLIGELISKFTSKLKFKRKVKKKVNNELEAVLDAKNIIRAKQKNGEPILDEDYERLRKANSNFKYRPKP